MKTKMFLHEVQCVTHMWTPTTTTTTEAGQLTFQQSARMPPSKGIPAIKKVKVKCRTIKYLHQYYHYHYTIYQKMCDNHHWSTAPSVSSSWCFPHLKILWTPVSWNKKQDEVGTDLIPELLLDAKIITKSLLLTH